MEVLGALNPTEEQVALSAGSLEMPPPPPTPTCVVPSHLNASILERLLQPPTPQLPPWLLSVAPDTEVPPVTRSFTSRPLLSEHQQLARLQKQRAGEGLPPQPNKTKIRIKVRLPAEGSATESDAVQNTEAQPELAQNDEAWAAIPFERKTIFNVSPQPISGPEFDARARFRLEVLGGDYSRFGDGNRFGKARLALAANNGLSLAERRRAIRVIRGLVAKRKVAGSGSAIIDMVKTIDPPAATV